MNNTNILHEFADHLREAGIVCEQIEADGILHRCGTTDKPGGKDGVYKAFSDEPASIWWKNWRTGEEGSWTYTTGKRLTRAEKNAFTERNAEAKKQFAKELAERRNKAAENAAKIWGSAITAPADHPYLLRKKVPPIGLRIAAGQNQPGKPLLMPMYNGRGELRNLQQIFPRKLQTGTDKLFMKDGCFFTIHAKDGGKSGPLLIAEGYATGATLWMATGYAVLVALDCGNLAAVGKTARDLYPNRTICFCADNDCTNKNGTPRENNPGVEAATRASATIGAKLAVCPAIEGRMADFNDLYTSCDDGLERVRKVIESALKKSGAVRFPDGYYVRHDGKHPGLFKDELKGEETFPIKIAPPIQILGRTRDGDSTSWGTLVQFKDPAGVTHQVAIPNRLLQAKGSEFAERLADAGCCIEPGQQRRFIEFVHGVMDTPFIVCSGKVGWYRGAYVLPDETIGAKDGEQIVLQSDARHTGLYQQSGTIEQWRDELAALAVGNTRLSFALCTAFAAPLTGLAYLESGGFSLEGGSSCGKTTCLQLAASVSGGPAHVRSWRCTDNGVEGLATLHSDGLLVLDEISQAPAKVLSEVGYMLSNGTGKARAGKDGSARKSATWRLLFLSSGEVGLAEKLEEAGMRTHAGQDVRFVGIPSDKGDIQNLHGFPDSKALVNKIKELCGKFYGTPLRAFLKAVVSDKTLPEELPKSVELCTNNLCPPEADSQIKRVADRFSLCAIAGNMAIEAGILPQNFDSYESVKSCFDSWLAARGTLGAAEDAEIVSRMKLFIELHGMSRFQKIDNMGFVDDTVVFRDRVGYRQITKVDGKEGRTIYYVFPEGFRKEVMKGFNPKRAATVLEKAGWLRRGTETDRLTVKVAFRFTGKKRESFYVIVPPEEN